MYYSILELLVQRSHYIRIKFPLHKPSENPETVYCSRLYSIRVPEYPHFLFDNDFLWKKNPDFYSGILWRADLAIPPPLNLFSNLQKRTARMFSKFRDQKYYKTGLTVSE